VASGLNGERFRKIVQEFDTIDPGAVTFRYPVKKDGTASIAEHFVFSPVEMSKILDPVLAGLSGACCGLQEHYNNLAEGGYEAQQYLE
jgi:hypothetical protein